MVAQSYNHMWGVSNLCAPGGISLLLLIVMWNKVDQIFRARFEVKTSPLVR